MPRARLLSRKLSSLRLRIVGGYVALMTLATLASVVVVYELSLARIHARIDEQLVQETAELRKLARGKDPETGRPFGVRVRRIFTVFLQRNIPLQNEIMLTFVRGEPYRRSQRTPPYRVDRDPELMARWAELREPDRGAVRTPVGELEYLAVPVQLRGRAEGVFVVGVFRQLEEREARGTVVAAGGVGLATLLIGSILAWNMANRVTGPVERVRQTAHSISETDLTRRIEVRGSDEIAGLAATFNEMLDRLEAAFATQRQLIDDAGHELRTPITIMRGHLEVLGEDPEERRETIALVLDELDRMSRMVSDLLLLAKAEQPDFLELGTVDVAALTEELESKARALAARNWRVENVGRGRIVADRQRLTQAMMQLAQNATQHTEDGDVVALGSMVADGEARLWVRDTGPGIPYGEQARIFDRFRRGTPGPRRADGGAGLGLAIVRAIAQAHNGRVELRSRPGGGATFTLVVPVDQPRFRDMKEAPE